MAGSVANDFLSHETEGINVVRVPSESSPGFENRIADGGQALATQSNVHLETKPHDRNTDEILHPINSIDDNSSDPHNPPLIAASNRTSSETANLNATTGNTETTEINKNQRLSARQSLSLTGYITIIGGTFLLLPFLAFLLFLWGGTGPSPGGAKATTLWRAIMLNGWALQSVTLLSLALRVLAGAQAAVCTSLLAGLLAERQYLPISNIAKLSVLRGMSASPLDLLWIMSPRNMRSASKWLGLEFTLAAILALTSLAVQFSSTILISDFGSAVLIQFPTRTQKNLALSESTLNVTFAGIYQEFGNHHGWPAFGGRGTTDLAKPNIHGLSDTGLQQRAFLPYDQGNRTTLRSFKGPTAVIATRVSCIPPIMDATFNPVYPDSTYPYGSINGTIEFNATFKGANISANSCSYDELHNNTACLPPTFSCTVGNSMISGSRWLTEWMPTLCHLVVPEVENTIPADPNTEFYSIQDVLTARAGIWNRDVDPWDEAAYWPFLVIATNATIQFLKRMNATGTRMLPLQPYQRYGEWSSFTLDETSMINITLCSVGFNMSLAHVELSSVDDPREPSVELNTVDQSLDGEGVQILLGASDIQDPRERGILTLDTIQYLNSTSTAELNPFQPGMGTGSFDSFLLHNSLILWQRVGATVRTWNDEMSVIICNPCWGWGHWLSRDTAAVFTRIINTVGRPALAIDMALYAIMSTWYYDVLPGFNVPGVVEVAFSKSCSVPRHWGGIIAVISVLAVHVTCVLVITIRYLRLIRYSRQGNIWHAISQLVSTPTRKILDMSNNAADKEIEEELRGNDILVNIDCSKSGRIEFMAKKGRE
ncbi:hypothetical protein NUW58_g397 [Xylaria curta]|uniref:Uncharacterized protein n=1 Tax=Xylaria curta TaxID=42375 RepID=A0ACC1PRX2_9PEZI|nr:hypothetical protein NUW58_g397 [Xylaria curta]